MALAAALDPEQICFRPAHQPGFLEQLPQRGVGQCFAATRPAAGPGPSGMQPRDQENLVAASAQHGGALFHEMGSGNQGAGGEGVFRDRPLSRGGRPGDIGKVRFLPRAGSVFLGRDAAGRASRPANEQPSPAPL